MSLEKLAVPGQSATQGSSSLFGLTLYFCNTLFNSVPAIPVCPVTFCLFGFTFSLLNDIEHATAVGSAIFTPVVD